MNGYWQSNRVAVVSVILRQLQFVGTCFYASTMTMPLVKYADYSVIPAMSCLVMQKIV